MPLEQQLQQLLHSQPPQQQQPQQPISQQQQQPLVQQQQQPLVQQQQPLVQHQQPPQSQLIPGVQQQQLPQQQPQAEQHPQISSQGPVQHENVQPIQVNQELAVATETISVNSTQANPEGAPKTENQTSADAEKQLKQQATGTRSQKPRRSNRSGNERIPKLSVTSVDEGSVINCHMENKLKTITFKFDIGDVNPVEIANKLVRQTFISSNTES